MYYKILERIVPFITGTRGVQRNSAGFGKRSPCRSELQPDRQGEWAGLSKFERGAAKTDENMF